MASIFKTRTFWSALATGVTGILHACGVAPAVTEIVTWGFGTLTAWFLRAGVLRSESPIVYRNYPAPRN